MEESAAKWQAYTEDNFRLEMVPVDGKQKENLESIIVIGNDSFNYACECVCECICV